MRDGFASSKWFGAGLVTVLLVALLLAHILRSGRNPSEATTHGAALAPVGTNVGGTGIRAGSEASDSQAGGTPIILVTLLEDPEAWLPRRVIIARINPCGMRPWFQGNDPAARAISASLARECGDGTGYLHNPDLERSEGLIAEVRAHAAVAHDEQSALVRLDAAMRETLLDAEKAPLDAPLRYGRVLEEIESAEQRIGRTSRLETWRLAILSDPGGDMFDPGAALVLASELTEDHDPQVRRNAIMALVATPVDRADLASADFIDFDVLHRAFTTEEFEPFAIASFAVRLALVRGHEAELRAWAPRLSEADPDDQWAADRDRIEPHLGAHAALEPSNRLDAIRYGAAACFAVHPEFFPGSRGSFEFGAGGVQSAARSCVNDFLITHWSHVAGTDPSLVKVQWQREGGRGD